MAEGAFINDAWGNHPEPTQIREWLSSSLTRLVEPEFWGGGAGGAVCPLSDVNCQEIQGWEKEGGREGHPLGWFPRRIRQILVLIPLLRVRAAFMDPCASCSKGRKSVSACASLWTSQRHR